MSMPITHFKESLDSSVSIAIGYGLDGRGSAFYILHSVQTRSGAHPASYPVSTGGLRSGREAETQLP
jgi:hypothetical protein